MMRGENTAIVRGTQSFRMRILCGGTQRCRRSSLYAPNLFSFQAVALIAFRRWPQLETTQWASGLETMEPA